MKEGETLEPAVNSGSWYYEDYTYTAATASSGFFEPFNSGDFSHWDVHYGVWVNHYDWAIHATNDSPSSHWSAISYNQDTFSDLDYTVPLWRNGDNNTSNHIFIRSDNTYRANGGCANCYTFQYVREGLFSVYNIENGTAYSLQNWTSSDAINTGSSWNYLRVVAQGSNLFFYINDTLVWSGTDSTHSSGRVGIAGYKNTSLDLWADWAELTLPGAIIEDSVSEQQQQLNQEANANPEGDITGPVSIEGEGGLLLDQAQAMPYKP